MRYLGIDFGLKGGLCTVNETGELISAAKMPLDESGEIDGYQVMVFVAEELASAMEVGESLQIYGEDLHSIFGASAKSNFNFGRGIGKVQGAIECLEVPVYQVKPRIWQEYIFAVTETPEMGETKANGRFKRDTKACAAWAAAILWPIENLKHDGLIDAALIAEWARRNDQIPKEAH